MAYISNRIKGREYSHFDLELKAVIYFVAVSELEIDNFRFSEKFGLFMPCSCISRIFSS